MRAADPGQRSSWGSWRRPRSRAQAQHCFGHAHSVRLRVNLFIEKVLGQDVEVSVLLPDGVGSDELELLQRKLIELVLHLPDVGLLQLRDGLLGGQFLLCGFPQVGFLSYLQWKDKRRK